MADVFDKTKVTTFRTGDNIYVPNPDGTDQYMAYTDLATYIASVAAGTWTTVVIADGVNQPVPLGAVASYEGFHVVAILGYSTNRATVFKDFVYDGSTAKGYSPKINGTLDKNLINLEQAAVQAGQFYWLIDNNTGGDLTVKYKVIYQFPAI